MHSTKTAMLAASCHAGTPVMPSRNITNTGAEKGKMLKTTQMGLFGNNRIRLKNQNGAIAKMVKIPANPWASRTVALMAATPADSTANSK